MNPVYFAILAAIVFGLWTIFHRLAAPYINQTLGAILVSFVAALLGGLVLVLQRKPDKLITHPKGVVFLILAGLMAFFIDFFALKTYASGLPVTIGGPIIIGGSIAVATVIGFFIGDAITGFKVLGLLMLVSGAAILAAFQ